MKILITGGAGYIGTELLSLLAASDEVAELRVYDNLSRGNRNLFIGKSSLGEKVRFIQGDLLDSRKLRSAMRDVDIVYHLAANVTTPFSDQNPHLFEQVNHWGTAELVYAFEESEADSLVYLSSVSVYGTSSDYTTTASPLNPRTFYGISKMRGEEHVQRVSSDKKTYILRCGNVYGYNKSMRFDAVINRFMFEANFHGRITVNGNGEQFRPFIHIAKVGSVLAALSKGTIAPGTYNLVDRNLAIGEVVEQLRVLYPQLEMLFVNQHMKMRELKVQGSEELKSSYPNTGSLLEELQEFKKAFTF
jgi:UDP-glucose 4-epimerase